MSDGAPRPGVDLTLDELVALAGAGGRLTRVRRPRTATDAEAASGRTPRRTRGMEFAGLRAYQRGDDVRHMAWRATARTGRPQVREFHAETDRPVLLCVDVGTSMRFATRGAFKSVVAARAAALLGWDAVRRGDRVGGLVCNGGLQRTLHPAARRSGLLQLLHALAALHAAPADGPGGLVNALAQLGRHQPRGSRLFVLSDFLDLDAEGERLLSRLARRSELLLLRVCDPLEVEPPPPGRYRLGDGDASLLLDGNDPEQRVAYLAAWSALDARLARLTGTHGRLLRLRTDDPLQPLLATLLQSLDGMAA